MIIAIAGVFPQCGAHFVCVYGFIWTLTSIIFEGVCVCVMYENVIF